MTDITELAQLRAELLSPAIGSNAHLRKIALSLVEALEKAQQRIDSQREYYEGVIADGGKRIAELESRTVKMPEPFKLAKSSSGLTYYFADDVDAALTDAGIKVEAE
ncbi:MULTISPECIES: hypothetical protein [Klebsiella pneumoniae complex]|uniref:hypothetical protein n=1 Tax=Klebsiella pneumoniae complex TaxID=3390273 RepID=UPI000BB64910|nr:MULTISPECIES: hypothetical protein [Klebsiella]PBP13955.1 hypothetical protein CI705_05670 [Klebsiella pneumoniae subsp. pneumoniae]